MNVNRMETIRTEITEAVRAHQEFLLLAHVNPDGDSLGSAVALSRVLASLGKRSYFLFPGDPPPELSFLLSGEDLLRALPSRQRWEVIFVLDIPCASRLPESLSGKFPPCKELINIDHHGDNTVPGTINWVDPHVSCVGEMLFWLFQDAGYAITAGAATALYTAILTDTGSFRFPNTTSSCLTAAARLLDYGADAACVAEQVYARHSLQKYRLLGEALGTLQTCCSGRAAYIWVTKKMLDKIGISVVETEGFVNFPRDLKGIEVAVLFKEEEDTGKIKVSLRSKGNRVEVASIAAMFQGGGHPTAAGCVVSGSADSVQGRVLEAVAQELARADAAAPDGCDRSSKG